MLSDIMQLDKGEAPPSRLCGDGHWRRFIFVFAQYITDRQEFEEVLKCRQHECFHCTAQYDQKDDLSQCVYPKVKPVHRLDVQKNVYKAWARFQRQTTKV
jgi:hypothetical protein